MSVYQNEIQPSLRESTVEYRGVKPCNKSKIASSSSDNAAINNDHQSRNRPRKLFEKMESNPSGWRINDVKTLCHGFGARCVRPSGGAHYKVSHPFLPAILTVPFRRRIKPVYIRRLLKFVDAGCKCENSITRC